MLQRARGHGSALSSEAARQRSVGGGIDAKAAAAARRTGRLGCGVVRGIAALQLDSVKPAGDRSQRLRARFEVGARPDGHAVAAKQQQHQQRERQPVDASAARGRLAPSRRSSGEPGMLGRLRPHSAAVRAQVGLEPRGSCRGRCGRRGRRRILRPLLANREQRARVRGRTGGGAILRTRTQYRKTRMPGSWRAHVHRGG
jgi:hypothetical protein